MAQHPEMKPSSILFITSWSADDPLLQSYALPYIKMIRELTGRDTRMLLLTWDRAEQSESFDVQRWKGQLQDLGVCHWTIPYRRFGWRAAAGYVGSVLRLALLARKERIEVLHPFAPAASAMAAMLRLMRKSGLVVDSWEPHADAMVETGTWTKASAAYRILSAAERWVAHHADVLLAASPAMEDFARSKWGEIRGRILVRPACVDLDAFDPDRFDRGLLRAERGFAPDDLICVVVSRFGGLYLSHEAFRFFSLAERTFGSSFRLLLLSSAPRESVIQWAASAGLSLQCITQVHVAHHQVPSWLAMGDFAFNPQKPVRSKRYGAPVKDAEYWAMGLPLVILPDISDDSAITAKEEAGVVLESLSDEAMSKALLRLSAILASRKRPDMGIRGVAEKYRSPQKARDVYRMVYFKDQDLPA